MTAFPSYEELCTGRTGHAENVPALFQRQARRDKRAAVFSGFDYQDPHG
jgi:peptide methionine sulfoxide reductase MsrA